MNMIPKLPLSFTPIYALPEHCDLTLKGHSTDTGLTQPAL